jgi:subtilisin family serine protease
MLVLLGISLASVRATAAAPAGKYWVFFKDKSTADAAARATALAQARQQLSTRALTRRAQRGASALRGQDAVTERDVAVADAYIRDVEAAGAQVVVRSRWLNAVSVRATDEQLARIAALPAVRRVQSVARYHRADERAGPAAASEVATPRILDPFYGRSFDQLAQMHLTDLHAQGQTGAGVIIGVLDSGFARWHEAFNHPGHTLQVIAEWDFVSNDPNAGYDPNDPVLPINKYQHSHGTFILGLLAAYKPGQLVGAAYDASYVLAKTEDISSETPIEEDYYVAGLEFVEMHGADIATSSLGYTAWYDYSDMDGQTAVTTIAVNTATSNGLICCTASGNGGTDQDEPSLIAPGDAFDVITVGAVTPSGSLTDFSSAGPTFDGRFKPEILARGQDASSVHDINTTGYNETLEGTSISTPLAAGAIACVLQAHPAWTVAQMRRNVFETAQDYHGGPPPSEFSARGYGVVDAFAAAQDCNHNGLADLIDIRAGTLGDCNGNELADMCETTGDFNGDGAVTLADAPGFLGCLTVPCTHPPCSSPNYANPCCRLADLDADGDVDLADFAQWTENFGGIP